MRIIKITAVLISFAWFNAAYGAAFEITTKLDRVMAYAYDSNYTANDCVLYFATQSPSACADKGRGVIKSGTDVGKLMCSVALTAFAAGQTVTVASDDQCNANHGAPIIRYIIINAN